MSDVEKETVIIVHGTWAAPKSDRALWYQPIDESYRQILVTAEPVRRRRLRGEGQSV